MNNNAGFDNTIYTVKLLDASGNPELNEKGKPKYQMVNATEYKDLTKRGRVELITASVVNEGKIIIR